LTVEVQNNSGNKTSNEVIIGVSANPVHKMKLPDVAKAYIAQRKLLDYLLSETHPMGKWKAQFLHWIRFNGSNVGALSQSLILITGNGGRPLQSVKVFLI